MSFAVRRCSVCAVEFTPKRRNQIHDKRECRIKKHNDQLRAVVRAGRAALARSPKGTPLENHDVTDTIQAPSPEEGAA